MTQTPQQQQMDLHGFDELTRQTRALLYYSLCALKVEVERMQQYHELHPNVTNTDIGIFYNNVKEGITQKLQQLNEVNDGCNYSLIEHFTNP